ncbi:MAG: hypothetical protein RBR82_17535 [Pseudomonas sp.]|jgi:hypothetical protein|nr:hypothetical protein [Pseudomonas sp.]
MKKYSKEDIEAVLQLHYRLAAIQAEAIKNKAKAEEDLTDALDELIQNNRNLKLLQKSLKNCKE